MNDSNLSALVEATWLAQPAHSIPHSLPSPASSSAHFFYPGTRPATITPLTSQSITLSSSRHPQLVTANHIRRWIGGGDLRAGGSETAYTDAGFLSFFLPHVCPLSDAPLRSLPPLPPHRPAYPPLVKDPAWNLATLFGSHIFRPRHRQSK
ncbi:hypothetical protein C8R45DRAFT_1193779 [Mycena sanguinolenta]|nr:hypothetical protein C8R45DRAFT_1193779 [Mycena sanguinolenta]